MDFTQPLPTAEELERIESRAKAALTYERSEYDPAEGAYTSPAESPNTEEDLTCPLCDGDGYIEGQRYDSKETYASTVVAYGIGEGLGRAEEWVENGPADTLRLVEAVRVLRNENTVIFGAFEVTDKNAKAFEDALQDIAEHECEYGDDCPPFGSRHGECVGCKARKALQSRNKKLRYEVVP